MKEQGQEEEDGPCYPSVILSLSSSSANGVVVRENVDYEENKTDRECQCFVQVCLVTWYQ